MKKIISVLFFMLSIEIFLLAESTSTMMNTNTLLYKDMTGISVVQNEGISNKILLDKVYSIVNQYNTYIAYYVYHNNEDISIYTTDQSLGGKIRLKSGAFPTSKEEYISNQNTKSGNQTGIFRNIDTQRNISIHPIDGLENMGGYSGVLYVEETDPTLVSILIEQFSDGYGFAKLFKTYTTKNLSLYIQYNLYDNRINTTALIISLGMLLFAISWYGIVKAKKIGVLKLHGYNDIMIVFVFLKELIKTSLISFGISSFSIIMFLIFKKKIGYILDFIMINISTYIFFLVVLTIILLIIIYILNKFFLIHEIIKGKKPIKAFMITQILIKVCIFVLILFFINLIQNDAKILNEKKSANEIWNDTENIYKIKTQFITDEIAMKRPLEIKAKEVYRELEQKVNLLLVRVDNYDKLMDGRYIWEANSNDGISKYSIYGTSITVNPNYLKKYSIRDIDGFEATTKIIYDENVRNILVPNSLKKYEDEIYQNHLKGFIYQKIDVKNIYVEKIGEVVKDLSKDDLSINIIYVPDNIEYFSFHDNIEEQNENKIRNPIVVIETGNIDESFYYSYLTNSCYYKSTSINPLDDILQVVQQKQMTRLYNSVESIFSKRAEEIQDLYLKYNFLIFLEIVFIFTLFFHIYLINACYYERYKYSIYIKRLLGYSMMRINLRYWLINGCISIAIILFVPGSWIIKISIFYFEVFITCLIGRVMLQKSLESVLKGEH